MGEANMMDKIATFIEPLGKALLELESYKDVADNKVSWKEIEEHFRYHQITMMKQFSELEAREKDFKQQESEFHSFLEVREADVAAKEQDMKDRIQELKNAAVVAITEVRAKHPLSLLEPMVEPMVVGVNKQRKVHSPNGDNTANLTSQIKIPHKVVKSDVVVSEVKPRPELMEFCRQMNAKGLLSFILENQKIIPGICNEVSVALKSASEPAQLVLASLEGFFPSDHHSQEGNRKDAVLQGMRQSCLLILKAMATLLAKADHRGDNLLNPEIKQQAKALADVWKPKLADAGIDAANENSLEVEVYLQLLAVFRIASEFDDEELCKLALKLSQKRQMPELCLSLGLADKATGVVESLINRGLLVDAVHLVHAFQLTESFPPVPLLKTYLKDLRRNSQGKGGSAAAGQNDANARELAALKAVIHCVHSYKLEANYPLDPLQRRVRQLERINPDKKRCGESGKHQQSKKPKTNGGFLMPSAASTVVGRQAPQFSGDIAYSGMAERFSLPVPDPFAYQTRPESTYGQPVYDQRLYYYPRDERVTAAYKTVTSNYGSYLGSGLPPSHQPYV